MEAIEDGQGQRDAQHQRPGGEAEHAQLHGRRLQLLHLERVHDPEGEVVDQQEGDQLAARLLAADALLQLTAHHVGDEDCLHCYLHSPPRAKDKQMEQMEWNHLMHTFHTVPSTRGDLPARW